jgi:putative mRNA 3-end processing factor
MPLIEFTSNGMYCPVANMFIDPWKPVDNAIITHGHSDHAYAGSKHYLAHLQSIPILKKRLGDFITVQGVQYGETITKHGVEFSLHPAGHVLGSAQIKIAYKGEIWVLSGDYKLQHDGVSQGFEPIVCNTFVTESTFGLPIFNWKPQAIVMNEINEWWKQNKAEGKTSILFAYSLGKAQRILQNIDENIGTIYVHGAIDEMNKAYTEAGILLKPYRKVSADIDKTLFKGSLVIAPSSADGSPWMKKFEPYNTANASGWMALRGARRRGSTDKGFVLSDHADWNELNTAIKLTTAENIIVTHGYTQVFSKWLCEKGLNAIDVKTQYNGELTDTSTEQEVADILPQEKPNQQAF